MNQCTCPYDPEQNKIIKEVELCEQEIAKAEGLKIKQKYPLQALYKNIIDVKDSINFILGNGQHQKSLYTSETISDLQNTRKTLNDFVKSTRDKCKRSCNQCKMRLEKEVMAIADATYQNKIRIMKIFHKIYKITSWLVCSL